ncbi:chemotaxis protein CheA [Halostagnicola kamekurae]|uniref:Chemotaxis protein CheA n=1 Tax=Halostagnicola kamekurae TaxID=619731 RepID=A0A1I6PSR9_9EURY|nr:chemotaxis protein CheA [Halostagnicola kamekurae]SFS43108.1 two-component system, chemotaxis family, sensor kinase CheA [Halostagnicola kamekurae]
MSDVFDTFIRESQDDLLQLNNSLLALEDNPSDAEAIDAVFRVSHNLKGNFGAMGFEAPSNLAHALEDLLDEVREGNMAVTNDRMNLLFEAVDSLDEMVTQIDESGEVQLDPSATVAQLRAEIDGSDGEEVTTPTDDGDDSADDSIDIPFETLAETEAASADSVFHLDLSIGDGESNLVDAMFVLGDIRDGYTVHAGVPAITDIESGEFEDGFELYVSPDSGAAADDIFEEYDGHRYLESVEVTEVTDALEGGLADDEGEEDGGSSGGGGGSVLDNHDTEIESIRVDVTTIDELYNQVEEMVTSRIKLRNTIEELGVSEVEKELSEHDKITSRIQDTVLEMRLVPVRTIAGHFPRLVRDIAQDQGKEINFEMTGVDIEMDRSILNEMRDPLVHLIRNAIDHGIEDPDVREAKGKPREGTIELRGTRERDTVTLAIEDDGAGLDPERIRSKAIEKDVMTPAKIQSLERSEVFELIFHPGFSTNDEVTDISGRGVGMDVVNRVVQSVDGDIDVESEPGEGTCVTLTLPVSVAIERVLFVEIGDEAYGIPIKNVDDISVISDLDVQSIDDSRILSHDSKTYPIIDLGESLSVPNSQQQDDDLIVRVKDDIRKVALRCNGMNGQEEVVIKPFHGSLSSTEGISGASVLGEGDVVMILDVESL